MFVNHYEGNPMQAQVSNKIQASVSKLIAKAWFDKDFYNRFVNETAAVLREAGLAIEAIVNPNTNGEAGLKLAGNGIFQIDLPAAPGLGDEHLYGASPMKSIAPAGSASCINPAGSASCNTPFN